MKNLKKKTNYLVLLVLFLGFLSIQNIINVNLKYTKDSFREEKNDLRKIKNGFIQVSPINIRPSSTYDWDDAASESWCTGNGTKDNPYIIEGIGINGQNSSSCLEIEYSDVFFIIQNCSFYNSSTDSFAGGIRLFETSNGIIRENNCSFNNRNGICLYESDNNIIEKNIARNNSQFGIKLRLSHNNTVKNNTNLKFNEYGGIDLYGGQENNLTHNIIRLNDVYGIRIYTNSKYNIIRNNTINANGMYGIFSFNGDNNTFIQNEIYNNSLTNFGAGFYIMYSDNNIFMYNNVSHNKYSGTYLTGSQNSRFISNRIFNNSRRGIFINNNANETIFVKNTIENNGYGGIELYDGHNVKINENKLNHNSLGSGSWPGIRLWNSNNSVIWNNTIQDNKHNALNIIGGSRNQIYNNNISNNDAGGIYFYCSNTFPNSNNNLIYNNRIMNNSFGIELKNPSGICQLNNVSYNYIYNNSVGIELDDDCNNNSIHNNEILITNFRSIYIDNSEYNLIYDNFVFDGLDGIYLVNCNFSKIYNNTILNHTSYALGISGDSRNNTYYLNYVKNNDHGVKIFSSGYNNNFTKNYFINNTINADDDSGLNYWNNSDIGNFWDDYPGVDDSPIDGIGDTPYSSNGVIDYLPIWDDDAPRILINLPINNSRYPNESPEFNIEVNEIYLDTMWYIVDNGLNNITFDSNGTIDQSSWNTIWGSLDDGEQIELSFYANDTFGHIGKNSTILLKDDFPILNIISPINNTRTGRTTPQYEIEIDDFSLYNSWYTLDLGLNNITFSNNGTFDQNAWETLWDSKDDCETILIRFYANDTFGQIAMEEISLIKDGFPIINLIFPTNGTQIERETFSFNIEVNDYLINNMWYTINGGATKYPFLSNETISSDILTVWDSKADGESITIEFFANDSLGQVSTQTVYVVKNVPETPSGGGIPGYDLPMIVLAALSVISILYIHQKRKK